MGTVLVTGSSGFIGRAVVSAAVRSGFRAVGFDRHPKDTSGVVKSWGGDLLEDFPFLKERIRESDGVINLAGVLGTSELLDSIPDAIRYNVEAASRIFLACLEFGKPCVQISPGNSGWLTSIYPVTKNAAEQVALSLVAHRGAKIAVVRAMNVFGRFQKHAPVRKLVPNLIRWAMLNEPARIYGNGEQRMDAIYVDDCAEILVRALRYLIQTGRGLPTVLEAGTGDAVTVNWMADRVWKEVRGWDAAPKVYEPMRPGEPENSLTVANPYDTLRPLGWINTPRWYDNPTALLRASYGFPEVIVRPLRWFTPFDEALRETVGWYKANPAFLGIAG